MQGAYAGCGRDPLAREPAAVPAKRDRPGGHAVACGAHSLRFARRGRDGREGARGTQDVRPRPPGAVPQQREPAHLISAHCPGAPRVHDRDAFEGVDWLRRALPLGRDSHRQPTATVPPERERIDRRDRHRTSLIADRPRVRLARRIDRVDEALRDARAGHVLPAVAVTPLDDNGLVDSAAEVTAPDPDAGRAGAHGLECHEATASRRSDAFPAALAPAQHQRHTGVECAHCPDRSFGSERDVLKHALGKPRKRHRSPGATQAARHDGETPRRGPDRPRLAANKRDSMELGAGTGAVDRPGAACETLAGVSERSPEERDDAAGGKPGDPHSQSMRRVLARESSLRGRVYAVWVPNLAGRVADAFEARIRAHEESALSALAVRSYETRGRLREEDECGIRTPFQRDRDRIVHSKPFRRLKGKTQVFIDPAGDHYRTRITHTLETTGIARVVARALRLNEDLTEAIGLGHDMGHPPFGHAGEERLDACLRERFGTGFHHNEQSLRIAEQLNLTAEVRDGILTHTGPQEPQTLEGKIVRLVDRVAYINHDIDDAIRWGLLTPDDLPRAEIELLGETGSTRIDTLVHDLIESSERAGDVVQSEEVGSSMLALRAFMFDRVYLGEHARGEHVRAHETISAIFEHLVERGESEDEIRSFVSGMTDRFALQYAERL